MKLFLRFLAACVRTVLLCLIFLVICAVVFTLASLPLSQVGYAAVLCAACALAFGAIDFFIFASRHRVLERMKKSVDISIAELPAPRSLIEKDYQELIAALFEHRRRLESSSAESAQEMRDYYTLWAHQIKTPIAAMRLLLDSEGAREYEGAPELDEQLFRIEQYVEMVLQYIRCEGGGDYVIAECDLDGCIRSCLRKYAGSFVRRQITLDYEETGLRPLTDSKWLCFVIEQLLSNSLKYTQTGGSVRIYADRYIPGVLVIEDTGIGISPEDLPRVFERGYTGYNGRADRKSTGIGLYLCRQILSRLGHTVTLESTVGSGTRVFLDLTREERTIE